MKFVKDLVNHREMKEEVTSILNDKYPNYNHEFKKNSFVAAIEPGSYLYSSDSNKECIIVDLYYLHVESRHDFIGRKLYPTVEYDKRIEFEGPIEPTEGSLYVTLFKILMKGMTKFSPDLYTLEEEWKNNDSRLTMVIDGNITVLNPTNLKTVCISRVITAHSSDLCTLIKDTMENLNIEKIVIPFQYRDTIIDNLREYGIHVENILYTFDVGTVKKVILEEIDLMQLPLDREYISRLSQYRNIALARSIISNKVELRKVD